MHLCKVGHAGSTGAKRRKMRTRWRLCKLYLLALQSGSLAWRSITRSRLFQAPSVALQVVLGPLILLI